MGTENFNLPLLSGTGSVKIPRDMNALANSVDATLKTMKTDTSDKIQKKYESPYLSQSLKLQKPILVFIDDDGKVETITKTKAIFDSKGKKFVSAVTTSLVDTAGYMTTSQVKQLQTEGHEISSHLVTHVGITDARLPEIGDSKRWFDERGLNVTSMTWVGGAFSDNAIAEAKKYYTCGTSVERGKNTPPVRQFILRRYAVGSFLSNTTVDGILEDGSQTQYNAMVDMAKNNNALVIAMMHNWHADFNTTQQARLEAMIDYAIAQGVEIMTLNEAMKSFGNLMDIGTDAKGVFRVGADGKVTSSASIDKLVYKNIGVDPAGINNTTLGTAFEKGFVTIASFKLTSNSGFPVSNAGTLETYYVNDQYTIQQRWYPYNNPTMLYYRQYNGISGVWNTWVKLSLDATAPVTVSIPAQTVNANSFLDYQLDHPDATNIIATTDVVSAVPIGGIENSVLFNVTMWTNKKIIIRYYNPTGAAINLAARNWRIKVTR